MDNTAMQPVVMEGYLLKKKRKKMQGMGRRYFRLSSSGELSYSFNPTSPERDRLSVSLAFISANRKHRTLDIDGGNIVYHCKALTLEDFDRWAGALKRFISIAQDQAANITSPEPLADGTYTGGDLAAKGSPDLGGPGAVDPQAELQKVLAELENMKQVRLFFLFSPLASLIRVRSQPIRDLELVCAELRQSESHLSVPSPLQPGTSTNGGNGNGSKFRFLGKRSNSTSQPHSPVVNAHRSPSFSAASGSQPPIIPPIPGLQPHDPQNLPSAFSPASPVSSYFDARPSASPSHSNDLLLRQMNSALAALKLSHAQLTSAVHGLPRLNHQHPYQSFDRPLSPLASPSLHLRTGSGLGFIPGHTRGAPSRASTSRASFSSFFSAQDGGEEWHDAVPGEFVLAEDEDGQRRTGSYDEEEADRLGGERRVIETTSEGTSTYVDSPSEDEDDSDGDATGDDSGNEEDSDDRATISGSAGGSKASSSSALNRVKQVQRRTQLPSPVAGDEFSMLSMLRKNVGKDLSTISFPVSMNEPLSALERIAEELEYSELLDRAAATKDPIERLTLVAVFAVSGTAGNKFRSSRKPFNPMLGETYECIRPEKGFRFVSEKVSHHPPILAFHGEAPQKGWQIYGHVAPSQKFWGRSMEVFVHGDCCVRFGDTGEVYSVKKPSSFVRNLVAGTKYLEVVGDLVVSSSSSSVQAIVSFKEGSTWGGVGSRNKIEGKVVDANGSTVVELVGRWDDAVDKKKGKNNFTRLWQINEFPPNPERYYGFSSFAVTLNESTPLEEGHLAPTDSRLRPDQLAFERGDVDEAERLKQLVEEKQRAKRKEGRAVEPRWFTEEGDRWSYGGRYFDVRDQSAFEDPDIFV
ncbi:hypothetical protein JCM11251_000596 [Rhodosporidiobolus azoricus]